MGSNAEVLWFVLVGSNGSLSIEKGEMSEYMDGHRCQQLGKRDGGRMGSFSSECYF